MSDAPVVTTDELSAALDSEGAYVLDVRNPDEYVEKHIRGVTLIPLGEIEARAAEVPTDRQVFVVCAAGGRSQKAANYLMSLGVDAVNVAGGTNKWVEEGRPFDTGE